MDDFKKQWIRDNESLYCGCPVCIDKPKRRTNPKKFERR